MKEIKFKPANLLIAFSFLFAVHACSDSSTSSDQDDPPALPSNVAPAKVDVDYFYKQNIPNEEQYSTYKSVEEVALTGSALLEYGNMSVMAESFLMLATIMDVQPQFENGSWIWTLSFSEDMFDSFKEYENKFSAKAFSDQFIIQIAATNVSGGTQWSIRFTGNLDDEYYFDNFELIRGFTATDEKSGEWNIYMPESGSQPVITYNWAIDSDKKYELSFQSLDFESSKAFSVSYSKDEDDNYLEYKMDDVYVSSISWNESSNSGYHDRPDETVDLNFDEEDPVLIRSCYSDFVNIECD